jgi:hypothetical protein
MRLARAGCGSVEYWMGLPISEVGYYLLELVDQLENEHAAQEAALKRRR